MFLYSAELTLVVIGSIPFYADAAAGLLELTQGQPHRALSHLVEAARHAKRQRMASPTVIPFGADLIEAHALTGQSRQAYAELSWFEEQARRSGSTWAAAAAARCRGILARDDAYESELLRAIDLHGPTDTFELARTELWLGRRLRGSHRAAEAREWLHRALERFVAAGSEPWAEQARVELRAMGDAPADSAGNPLAGLTPQELQVALLVARGATNAAVASSLFISAKTVEFHLGHVYRKLDLRSRTELAARVAGLA